MIAEHLFLLHFLGLRDAETDRLLANELLARRRERRHLVDLVRRAARISR